MAIPLRNIILDKIKEAGSLTDAELFKMITKDDLVVSSAKFNKMLLDLEILGLINVTWMTKDEKRVEIAVVDSRVDDVEMENKKMLERDYESSFPGFEG